MAVAPTFHSALASTRSTVQMAVALTFYSPAVKRILTWIQEQLNYILNKSYTGSNNSVR